MPLQGTVIPRQEIVSEWHSQERKLGIAVQRGRVLANANEPRLLQVSIWPGGKFVRTRPTAFMSNIARI